MAKVHIHCNDPDAFFGLLSELSETPRRNILEVARERTLVWEV